MKAHEARKLSLSIQSDGVQKQTEEVYTKIRVACDKGEMSCVFFGTLLPGLVQKLTADGFKLSQKEDNDRGMSVAYFEISW